MWRDEPLGERLSAEGERCRDVELVVKLTSLTVSADSQKDDLLVGSGKSAGADEDDFHVVSRSRKEVNDEEKSKSKGKVKRLVGGKFVVRVDDDSEKPKVKKPRPPPAAKVRTVKF